MSRHSGSTGSSVIFATCRFGLAVKSATKLQRKARNVGITIYGLIWLAAMLLIAFWFAYADEFSSPQEKSSFDLVNNAPSKDSQGIEIAMENRQSKGKVV